MLGSLESPILSIDQSSVVPPSEPPSSPNSRRIDLNLEAANALSNFAVKRSQDPAVSFETIIHDLTREAVKINLLKNEFIEIFTEKAIARKIVESYVRSTLKRQLDILKNTNNSEDDDARKSLMDFIEYKFKIKSTLTLSDFLSRLSVKFPNTYVYKFLDNEDVKKALTGIVEKGTIAEISSYYRELFEADAEEFLFEHILPGAIEVSGGELHVDKVNLRKSLKFLADEDCLEEQILYEKLYEWLEQKGLKIERNLSETRRKLGYYIAGTSNKGVEYAQYDRFFDTEIVPAIRDVRTIVNKVSAKNSQNMELADEFKSKRKPKDVHLIDLVNASPDGLAQTYISLQSGLYLKGISRMHDKNGNAEYMKDFKKYFNCADLSDEEAITIVNNDIAVANQCLKNNIDKAVQNTFQNRDRNADGFVDDKYQFIQQIESCRDVQKLIQWIVNPRNLLDQLDERESARLVKYYPKERWTTIISHQASRLFYNLLIYRNHAIHQDYAEAEKNRGPLQRAILADFGLTENDLVPVDFKHRVAYQINESGNAALNKNGEKIWEFKFATDSDVHQPEVILNPTMDRTEENGVEWQWEKIQTESYALGKAKVIDDSGNEVEIDIYFYLDKNKQIISVKPLDSLISNVMREGEGGGDGMRGAMFIVDEEKRELAFRTLMQNHSSRPPDKVKFAEKRHSKNKSNVRKAKKLFRKSDPAFKIDPYSFTGYSILNPENKDPKGRRHVRFELKAFGPEVFLYWHSENGPSSHGNYEINREQETLKDMIFPEHVYGKGSNDCLNNEMKKQEVA